MTDRRQARNVAEAVPQRLRARLANAADGVWVTTLDGLIVFWNRAAEAALGYCARDVVGRHCADIVTGRDDRGRPFCSRGCDSSLPTRPGSLEHSFGVPTFTKHGRRVWLEVTTLATDPANANGHAPGGFVIHVFHEATRRKELLRTLREQLGPAGNGERLTARELDVLRVMARGLGTADAAKQLGVSRATIRNHVQNIFSKLNVHTRLQAVLLASARDLLP
jgi:PAS domain S-box-containing protein